MKAGTRPDAYNMTVDEAVRHGDAPSARIQSIADPRNGFGTLMQVVDATQYRGKRIRLSGYVKAKDVLERAGLWMRVDGNNRALLAFDNMQDRPIRGTRNWQRYEVVLDVPESAYQLAFGTLLRGTGTVWVSDLSLQPVTRSVPTTGIQHEGPTNLDFAQ